MRYKRKRKGYDYTYSGHHCPVCGYPLSESGNERRGASTSGMEDWVLVHCPRCGPILLVAPEFHDLVEYYDREEFLLDEKNKHFAYDD